jgi:hypothetical protein
MPTEEKKSLAIEVGENLGIMQLGIPEIEKVLGAYLYGNLGADDQLLRWIAQANAIEFSELEKFKGVPVLEFYSKIVCGGVLMELKKDGEKKVSIEAPLAFQSAMAGILEMAELVILKTGLRKKPMQNVTQFYPLSPVRAGINPNSFSFAKDGTGRCICNDEDFKNAYKKKWN